MRINTECLRRVVSDHLLGSLSDITGVDALGARRQSTCSMGADALLQ